MVKLKALPGRLSQLPPRLKNADKVADPFYNSPEWRALASEVKKERGNKCEICGSRNRVIADHIKEIRDGGARLDKSNIQLLCTKHHNQKTHAERARRARGEI